jgi:hypothetical protein
LATTFRLREQRNVFRLCEQRNVNVMTSYMYIFMKTIYIYVCIYIYVYVYIYIYVCIFVCGIEVVHLFVRATWTRSFVRTSRTRVCILTTWMSFSRPMAPWQWRRPSGCANKGTCAVCSNRWMWTSWRHICIIYFFHVYIYICIYIYIYINKQIILASDPKQ